VAQTRFEGLAREVAGSRSHRQVLRALAVGSGLGALALLGVKAEAQANATCVEHGNQCGSDAECCGNLRCLGDLCHQPEGGRRRR
jgi:diaminopimelate epimerase